MSILTILGAYALLMLMTFFLDPKRRGAVHEHSILHLFFFSTLKMLFVIGLVVAFAMLDGSGLSQTLGFTGFLLTWRSIACGILAGAGFVLIYVLWQTIASRFKAKNQQGRDQSSSIIDILPKRWLPLVAVFAVISIEAGLLEEIFFRGIMQSNILGYVQTPWAVIICGVCFGVAHFYQGIFGVVGTSLLGVWLGASFALSGNILIPIVGHVIGDFSCMMLGGRSIIERGTSSQRSS